MKIEVHTSDNLGRFTILELFYILWYSSFMCMASFFENHTFVDSFTFIFFCKTTLLWFSFTLFLWFSFAVIVLFCVNCLLVGSLVQLIS